MEPVVEVWANCAAKQAAASSRKGVVGNENDADECEPACDNAAAVSGWRTHGERGARGGKACGGSFIVARQSLLSFSIRCPLRRDSMNHARWSRRLP